MSQTAPQVTDAAVRSAKQFDCVVEAKNKKEWMYVEYAKDTTEAEKAEVENTFNPRLERERGPNGEREDGERFSEIGLYPSGNFEVYFLVPSGW